MSKQTETGRDMRSWVHPVQEVTAPAIIVTKARDPAPAQQNVRASTPLTGNTPVKAPAQAPQMAKYVQPVLSANKAAPATATTKPVASNAALSF